MFSVCVYNKYRMKDTVKEKYMLKLRNISKEYRMHIIDVSVLALVPIIICILAVLVFSALVSNIDHFTPLTVSVYVLTLVFANLLTLPSVLGVLKGNIARQIKYIE